MTARGQDGLARALAVLWGRRATAVLVAVPVLLGCTLSVSSLPDEYEATTTVAFAPRADVQVGADVVRLVLPRYVAYLSAEATVRRLADELGRDPDELGDQLDVSVSTDTANLPIVVRGPDPQEAADAANRFAEAGVEFSRADALLLAARVAPAVPAEAPSGPPRLLLQLAGLLAALVLGTLAALLHELLRPRLVDAEQVSDTTGVPVLGVLPRRRGGADDVPAALRAVWLRLAEVAAPGEGPLVVALVSAGGDARAVGAGCAAAAALEGRRVLLVDGAPGGGTVPTAPGRPALRGQAEPAPRLDDLVRPLGTGGGQLLPGGSLPRDPRSRRAVLGEARNRADVVLVVCPALDAPETPGLLADVGTAVLVLPTPLTVQHLQEAVGSLAGLPVKVVGTVLDAGGRARGPATEASVAG